MTHPTSGYDAELIRRVEDAFDGYVSLLFDGEAPDRDAFLAGLDEELRERVAELIDQYAEIRSRVDAGPRGFRPGRQVGHYRLEREIGRGAMGIVFEAWDLVLERDVAIKLLYPIYSMTEHVLQRFQREASAGGRLNHPGIVQVHEIGEDDGTHYIALELVRGGSIEQFFAGLRGRRHLPGDHTRRMARMVADIAEALAVAHAEGVVHRDIKPANLLLTGEGTPKIADFGLAWIEEEISHTGTGVSTGTPFYMSPEQADPSFGEVGPHTDVFSLGVTLYEALTLERPFLGDTRQQVADKILHQDPVDPRRLRSRIPRDLAVVCIAALEKNPAERYTSARELAADLRRFLADEPIVATPPSTFSQAVKWCRRHKAVSSAAAVLVIALLVVTGLLVSLRASNERNEATLSHVIPLLRAIDSPDSLDDAELDELLAFAMEELETGPEQQVVWLSVLGRELAGQGRYETARRALERAWALVEGSEASGGVEGARLGADLARCLLRTDRESEAEELLRAVISQHGARLGESERIELQGELIQVMLRSEDPDALRELEAEIGDPRAILDQLLAYRSGRAGSSSVEALAALLLLAEYETRIGQLAEAAELLEGSQGRFYGSVDSSHPRILERGLRLAEAREALGDTWRALRMTEDLAARAETGACKLDEADTGELHVTIGRLRSSHKQYEAAIQAYRVAVDRAPAGQLGLAARQGLASALLESVLIGQAPLDAPEATVTLAEAEQWIAEALRISQADQELGPSWELRLLSELSFLALVRGEDQRSAELHETLLAERARLDELGDDAYVGHLERAALAHERLGNRERARALRREAWDVARDELGPRSDRTMAAFLLLLRDIVSSDGGVAALELVDLEIERDVAEAELDPIWIEILRGGVLLAEGRVGEAGPHWERARALCPVGVDFRFRHALALRGYAEVAAPNANAAPDVREVALGITMGPLITAVNYLRPRRTATRLESELFRLELK